MGNGGETQPLPHVTFNKMQPLGGHQRALGQEGLLFHPPLRRLRNLPGAVGDVLVLLGQGAGAQLLHREDAWRVQRGWVQRATVHKTR